MNDVFYVPQLRPDEIFHYGIPERSGRYPWGSGDRPYQRLEVSKPKKKTREEKYIDKKIKKANIASYEIEKSSIKLEDLQPHKIFSRILIEKQVQKYSKDLDKYLNELKERNVEVLEGLLKKSEINIYGNKNKLKNQWWGRYFYTEDQLKHSAKGSEWEDYKYVKKIDGVYYYPVGYEDGRTIDDLSDNKKEDKSDKDAKNKSIDEVKNHFDQYLAKRGIDWRTLPKDEVDKMQRDIIKQLESGKETGTSEKSAEELAKDVISGKLGDGEARKALLGDSYSEVQKKVNEIVKGSTGSKKTSEATEDSIKKVTKAAKNASNVHSGVNMDQVMSVYNKNKK